MAYLNHQRDTNKGNKIMQAYIKGDKFIREIEVTETPKLVSERLENAGFDNTYYLATRTGKGGREFVSLVMRNVKTGEFTYAF